MSKEFVDYYGKNIINESTLMHWFYLMSFKEFLKWWSKLLIIKISQWQILVCTNDKRNKS